MDKDMYEILADIDAAWRKAFHILDRCWVAVIIFLAAIGTVTGVSGIPTVFSMVLWGIAVTALVTAVVTGFAAARAISRVLRRMDALLDGRPRP